MMGSGQQRQVLEVASGDAIHPDGMGIVPQMTRCVPYSGKQRLNPRRVNHLNTPIAYLRSWSPEQSLPRDGALAPRLFNH